MRKLCDTALTSPNRAAAKRNLCALFLSATLLALTACTGTGEEGTPILLVVGYQSDAAGAAGKVGLVRSTFGVPGAARELSLTASRNLPAAPIAYDVTDRSNDRNELVVLSRGASPAPDAPAFLSFFNLAGIGSRNLKAFKPMRPEVALSAADLDLSAPDLPLEPQFCPVDVQVSRTGRYAALLHDGAPCGISGFAAVDVLDLGASPVKLLERLDVQIEPAGFYLAQSGADAPDSLYFFQDDPAGVQLTRLTLPGENARNPTIDPFLGGDLEEIADLSTLNQDVEGLGLVLAPTEADPGRTALITLFSESFVPTFGYAGGAPDSGARRDGRGEQAAHHRRLRLRRRGFRLGRRRIFGVSERGGRGGGKRRHHGSGRGLRA